MSDRRLELIRWTSAFACLGIVVAQMWNPELREGGLGAMLFFGFLLFGFPAAMITLHLHPPKWLVRFRDR